MLDAALAQLVEQFIRNEKVDSSNPSSGTNYPQSYAISKFDFTEGNIQALPK